MIPCIFELWIGNDKLRREIMMPILPQKDMVISIAIYQIVIRNIKVGFRDSDNMEYPEIIYHCLPHPEPLKEDKMIDYFVEKGWHHQE